MDKKHPCADCRECLWCSDERCRLCLKSKPCCRRKKLSMTEQIALYDEVNRKKGIEALEEKAPAGNASRKTDG